MSDTKPDLDAIEARANAATPGPWRSTDSENAYDMPASGMAVLTRDVDIDPNAVALICDEWYENDPDEPSPFDDAEFIAHAREDVPALVAYARTLEAENERLRGAGETLGEHGFKMIERAEAAEAERDRARATAVHLEQELAQIRQRTEES